MSETSLPNPKPHIFQWDEAKAGGVNLEQTLAFLKLLVWPGEEVWIQTFQDGPTSLYLEDTFKRKDGSSGSKLKYKISKDGKTIRSDVTTWGSVKLEEFQPGTEFIKTSTYDSLARVGVFLAVNALDPDAKNRSSDTVRRVRALFADFDGKPLPSSFCLRPTAIVESSPGRFHVYWAVSDVPLEDFTPIQKYLAQHFGSDPVVCDLARVMRLPGFWHGKKEPGFLSRVLEQDQSAQYTRADFLGAFEGLEAALEQAQQQTKARLEGAEVSRKRALELREELKSADLSDRAAVLNKYAQAGKWDEVGKLSSTGQGGRNAQLFKSAAALGSLVGAGILERGEASLELEAAAFAVGLDEREVRSTLENGLRAGEKTPRDLSNVAQLVGQKKGRKAKVGKVSSTRVTAQLREGEQHTSQRKSSSSHPEIIVTGRFLREIADDALAALEAANTPPTLFRRGGELVRVAVEEGHVRAKPLDAVALKGTLDRAADFMAEKTRMEKGEDGKPKAVTDLHPTRPPSDLAPDLLARVDRLPFPTLRTLATSPIYSPSGEQVSESGYHFSSEIYLELGTLEVPRLPSASEALVLLREMLQDFPFIHKEAGFAHTLAALLLPFSRPLIDGPTPLHLIEAPTRGSGKGLLCEVISYVSLGRAAGTMVKPKDGDEFEKRVTSALLEGAAVMLLDNVHTLEGEALAAALTARVWRGRRLGKSEMLTLPNDALWLATGNNVNLDDDMPRRIIPIRLDPQVERPEDRTDFLHADLLGWVKTRRGELVAACLSLIQAWLEAGRPAGKTRLGSYESWAATMGGILETVGVKGFLTGREHLYETANAEPQEWAGVLAEVYRVHGDAPVTAREVLSAMKNSGNLGELWEGRRELSALQRIGHALRQKRDRVFSGLALKLAGETRDHSRSYRVVPATKELGKNPANPADPRSSAPETAQTPAGFPQENPAETPHRTPQTPAGHAAGFADRNPADLTENPQNPAQNPAALETVSNALPVNRAGFAGFFSDPSLPAESAEGVMEI